MSFSTPPSATLKIVQVGHPVLRQRARPLSPAEIRGPEMVRLIEQMRETMRDAPGVGLAAPQIGLPLQLFVMEDLPEYIERGGAEQREARARKPVPFQVLCNPRLTIVDRQAVEHFEGCLSLTDFVMVVARAHAVTVEALDHRGRPVTVSAEGWPARILQHEIDHLRGVLCIDRMSTRTFASARNHARYHQDRGAAEILAQVGTTDEPDAPLAAPPTGGGED